ncbi:hypothetical protein H9623_06590 [Oerskovia sp. Sa1BUA8]|uniref:Meckel syndrome type 1 protein n=1 Tax=Oerskovia douganii TaxID=2762210 RepID=A0A9D5U8X8_9CELL|nr:hypothetical protein [Oerskovia douganii]MBE7699974.1 hypothetical protein [Oerskovia douganii]
MSDQHGSMQPVRPLTRREIREREAAAAEQAAGAAPSAPGGYTPPAPAAPAAPPPSRRSMRDVSAPTPSEGYSNQAPVVRPPSMTGGMRGVDETGRLTPIQETAERVPLRPAQSPPPGTTPPVRQSMRAPSTAPSPFGAAPRPASPEPAPQSAPAPFPPAQPSPFPPAQSAPARESVSSRTPAPDTPRAAATPAPAPAPLPWEQGTAPSSLAQQAPESARPALPWETQPPAATPAAAQASPFPGAVEDSPFPVAGATRPGPASRTADDDEDDAYDERPPGHAYTWLHYLILIAVAFVLGLLIWRLLLGDSASVAEALAPVGLEALTSSPTNHHGLSF